MDTSNAQPWPLLLLPLLVVAIWFAISMALARLGGWRELARQFPATGRPAGERSFLASAAFRLRALPIPYASCLTVTIGEAGVRLGILFPFRAFHRPLFIPWTEIESVTREARSFGRRAAVVAVRHFGGRIALYGRPGEKVAAAFERREASASIGGGRRSRAITLGAARPLG